MREKPLINFLHSFIIANVYKLAIAVKRNILNV